MNYLVTYSTPKHKKRIKTFTFQEANEIAKYAMSKGFKNVSVSPLNDEASLKMDAHLMCDSLFKDLLSSYLK